MIVYTTSKSMLKFRKGIGKCLKIKKSRKAILFDYFTFDDFHSFEWVDFFSFVVNFRC